MSSKEYMKQYHFDNKEKTKEYNKEYRIKHKESLKEKKTIYNKNHKEKIKAYGETYKENIRIDILNIISNNNPVCVRCGCDDVRLLEINHKNGGGGEERKKEMNYYQNIHKGRRKTDDLELLCRVCNAWHYLELKYGKLPYKVSYFKEDKKND